MPQQEFKVVSAQVAQGGVRVDFEGGQWWLFNLRTATFTRHQPGTLQQQGWGKPILGPERVTVYKSRDFLLTKLGHCQALIQALEDGIMRALLADEARKAGLT